MKKLYTSLAVVAALIGSLPPAVSAEEVNVYSARKEALIKPLLDKFTEETGIEVNLVTGSADALITRIASEGKFSPADVLITTDAGRLVRAKQAGITQPMSIGDAHSVVADYLKDNELHWTALTIRARPIMYAPDRFDPTQINSILDLADEKFKGQICIRSSSNIYNQSMIAALTLELGEQQVSEWAKGIVANMARDPKGGDRDQIKGVASGQCDIAVANTYYLAGMLDSDDETQKAQAQAVKVLWTDQDGFGTHINVSGAAVAKSAPNADNANALLAFMLTDESQQWYAQENHEYPVVESVEQSELMQSFGDFKALPVELDKVGAGNADALKLMDKVGWK